MKKKYLVMVFLYMMFFGSCGKGKAENVAGAQTKEPAKNGGLRTEYKKMSAADAQRFMRETDAFILLDVRTEEEHRQTRIPGSKLLPDYELAAQAAAELPDKNTPLLVYCRSGRRSAGAARALIEMGYTQVYDIGGIVDWPYEKEGD